MRSYRFYYLDRNNHIIMGRDHEHPDDADAMLRAVELSTTHAVEVWQEGRLVGRLPKCNPSAKVSPQESTAENFRLNSGTPLASQT